jgi:hypothetical protein
MAIRTIFSTVEDCSRGVYQGWYELVRDYTPVGRMLLAHYFPTLQPDLNVAVTNIFATARANDNAWFGSLRFANEREFAMAFGDLVFACGRSEARLPAPKIAADQIFALLEGLTLIERELFWVFLMGWNVQQGSAILMNASATAEETHKVADEKLAQLGPKAERSSIALVAIEAAQSRRGSDCLPWKTFNNLINGQISWDEREAAERHLTGCVHCLNAFTAFQEMIWLQKHAVPLGEKEAEALAAALGMHRASKGLLGRFFPRVG